MSNFMKHMRILFAEDDDLQRDELSVFLRKRVKKVYSVKNGFEAIEKYKLLKPDIILTDLRMPKVDGLELVKRIREVDRITPIIVITAMNDKETILKSLDLGITNYVVKPLDVEELVSIIEKASETLMDIKGNEYTKLVASEKINALKNRLTKFVKSESGKGPSDIRINVSEDICSVTIYDVFTQYELSLLKHEKNGSLIEHGRTIFFQDRKEELEQIIVDELGLKFSLARIISLTKENKCELQFDL
jgi:CheY-like chemotaxis protein